MSKKKKELSKLDEITINNIGVYFKIPILKKILRILTMEHSGYRTLKSMKNINKLFTNIDLKQYKNNTEALAYIWCICYISKQWLGGITDPEIIVEVAKGNSEYDELKGELMQQAISDKNVILEQEAKSIFDLITEALQQGYIIPYKEEIINLLDDININEPGAYKILADRLFNISKTLMDIKYNTNILTNKIEFNTANEDSIKNAITQTIESLSSKGNIFKTGIKRLNTLLSPGYMNGRLYVYMGLPASYKAQPDDTLIPTPDGFRQIGDLKVGDYVFDLNGNRTKVIGVQHHGVQETYKVTFTDGRSTRCNLDHLWYRLAKNGHTGKYNGIVTPLRDMIDDYVKPYPSCLDKKHHKYIFPNNGIAKFNHQKVPLDPWVLGYIIGNGCCRETGFKVSTPDEEMPLKIADRLGIIACKEKSAKYSWYFRYNEKSRNRVSSKDIFGNIPEIYQKYSHEKKIPMEYIINDIDTRWAIIQGLFDSDGSIALTKTKNGKVTGSITYGSTSYELITQIGLILNSLGIGYTIYEPIINKYSTHHYYRMCISTYAYNYPKFFSYSKKLKRAKEFAKHVNFRNYNHIRLANVEKVEDTPQTCIAVDNELGVYLTENFIPTHNSGMLLKSALDIREFNPNFQTKTPGMTPCVLLVTMENTYEETIERIWNMYFDDAITDHDPEEAIHMMFEKLGYTDDDSNNDNNSKDNNKKEKSLVDILDEADKEKEKQNIAIVIQYKPYRSIDTDDLYTMIEDLREENMEVCVLILDYIKRISPAVPVQDNLRLELDHIMNELKALAIIKNIPVITAHQMNRSAAATVDNAIRQGKSDVNKLVGREHIGDSFSVYETADWVAVLNVEYKPGTDQKYLTINTIKQRRIDRSEASLEKYKYIVHPFSQSNSFRLLNDVKLDKVLSLQSLVSDLANLNSSDSNNKLEQLPYQNFNYSKFE